MADVFNKTPNEYVDLNDLFPVLNDRVGMTWQQFQALVENVNYVKNNASGGGDVSSVNGQKGDVVLTSADIKAVAEDTVIKRTEYQKSIKVLPQFDSMDNPSVKFVFDSENVAGLSSRLVEVLPDGVNVSKDGEAQRPTINGEEVAYLSDLAGSGGGFDLSMLPKYESKVYIDCSKRSSLNGLVTFNIVESSNFAVDWGDGSEIESFTEATTVISHQYETSTFATTIRIYGDWQGFNFGNSTDYNKYVLIGIEYGENIKNMPMYALYKCDNLTNFKALYSGKFALGYGCFTNCANLATFYCNGMLSLANDCFKGCTALRDFPFEKLSSSETMSASAFSGCFKNLKTLELGIASRASSGLGHFSDMTSIISLKTNFTGNTSFSGCTNLTNVEIIDNDISQNLFNNCTNLKVVKMTQPMSDTTREGMSNSTGFGTKTNVETIFVRKDLLKSYKNGTNWVQYADKIYPDGGQYSETVTIPVANWADNAQTVEVIGATAEMRNVIEFVLVDANGNQIEDTYGLTATQGTMSMTFTCQTVPTEDIQVFVVSQLTNY